MTEGKSQEDLVHDFFFLLERANSDLGKHSEKVSGSLLESYQLLRQKVVHWVIEEIFRQGHCQRGSRRKILVHDFFSWKEQIMIWGKRFLEEASGSHFESYHPLSQLILSAVQRFTLPSAPKDRSWPRTGSKAFLFWLGK